MSASRDRGRFLRKASRWAPIVVVALALAMLALTVVPAEAWRAPATDASFSGFDPNLIYPATVGDGVISVSKTSIDMTTHPNSQTTVTLLTTPMQTMDASIDVLVADDTAAIPFRIGLWSPWTDAGIFVVFSSAPADVIAIATVIHGGSSRTLAGGDSVDESVVGHYAVGMAYRVAIRLDRVANSITTEVSSEDGQIHTTVASTQVAHLFGNSPLSLTGSTSAGKEAGHVVLSNYVLTLPHERWWVSRVADPIVSAAMMLLGLGGLVAMGVVLAVRLRRFWPQVLNRITARGSPPVWKIPRIRRSRVLIAGALVGYVIGNVLLFQLGSHPYDMANEKVYAYIGGTYGMAQLYYLPNVVPDAGVWSGVPYSEAAFPYGPAVAYLFGAIGWLGHLGPLSSIASFPHGLGLEYLIKSVNVLFGLGDGVLIYLILQLLGVARRSRMVASALFLFNPAVWFSMSVWGQTHVISLFFVLASIFLAERRHVHWAWIALAVACLTRPQMAVFGILLGVVLLRKFSLRQNVFGLAWAMIFIFVACLPLTLATAPSLAVDVMLHTFKVEEAGANVAVLTTVSQDAYSIWPLVTYLAHGSAGPQRMFTLSSSSLIGSISYQTVSQVLTIVALILVAIGLWLRRRTVDERGGYIPLLALGITSFLMLLTGLVSTHFLLALPILILCLPWMNRTTYGFVVGIWTITTFVPMYGDLSLVITSQDHPLLASASNGVTHFFVSLYASDRFITTGVVANICAAIWLAVVAARQPSRLATPSSAAATST
jgi:uncharacterized membrane protein YiaA